MSQFQRTLLNTAQELPIENNPFVRRLAAGEYPFEALHIYGRRDVS